MKIAMCCAADEKTKYLIQALRWAQSIRWFGAPADLFVGLTDECPPYYRDELLRLDVQLVQIPRASDWHGPSNKLGVLLDPALRDYDYVVLSDCDIAVVGDITPHLHPHKIRAKPADLATLGDDVLERVFASAGQPLPELRVCTSVDRVRMHPYCNSGFLIFAGELLAPFMERWLHWNRFVLENSALLGDRAFFTDQASFALALAEHIGHFEELPVEMNYPCHLGAARYPQDIHEIEPTILHYHDRVDGRTGLLMPMKLPGPDRAIAKFNSRVSEERRKRFCNPTFWDERYLRFPELGSGLGSRGEHLELKASIVADFLHRHPGLALVDFGCGDCALLDLVSPGDYLGVDGSREIIDRNRKKFPGHNFFCQQLEQCTAGAPLSLCFDVLIHQHSREGFDAVLDQVLSRTGEAGLINGFDEDPGFDSDIVFFHQPLAVALADRGLNLRQLGTFRKTPIYEWWR